VGMKDQNKHFMNEELRRAKGTKVEYIVHFDRVVSHNLAKMVYMPQPTYHYPSSTAA